jgi:hypothetical protein
MVFSKRPKTIFVRRKNQLCHKVNRMKIADFYVAQKMVLGRFGNTNSNAFLMSSKIIH